MTDKAHPELGGLSDLPDHAISCGGRLVGFWEYDPQRKAIAYCAFGAEDKALSAAVARTEAFIKSDLGDAWSFSIDSPKSRIPRIEGLRKMAARR